MNFQAIQAQKYLTCLGCLFLLIATTIGAVIDLGKKLLLNPA